MTRLASHFRNPASDARVARVWTALDSRLERAERQRPLRRGVFGVAALAAIGVSLYSAVYVGGLRRTDGAGMQVLALAEGSRVEHAAGEPIAIDAVSPERVELRMTRGRAVFHVARNPKRAFLTHARGYTIRVIGTEYSVELAQDTLRVEVVRGEVEVRRDASADVWRVRAGERWASSLAAPQAQTDTLDVAPSGARPTASQAPATSPLPTATSPLPTAAALSPATAARSPAAAAPLPTGASQPSAAASTISPARPTAHRPVRADARSALHPDTPVPSTTTPNATVPNTTTRNATAPNATTPNANAPNATSANKLALGPTSPATSSVGASDAAALFARAQRARVEGRPEDTVRLLGEFLQRFPADPRAGLAAFQLGRGRQDLGDAKGALAAFDQAARAGSAFKEQIEARRVQAFEQLGELAACRAAREAFLRAFPSGSFADMVRRRCP